MCGIYQEGHDALYKAERNLNNEEQREDAEEIIAVLKEETVWRRVKNFVEFLQTGYFSSAEVLTKYNFLPFKKPNCQVAYRRPIGVLEDFSVVVRCLLLTAPLLLLLIQIFQLR